MLAGHEHDYQRSRPTGGFVMLGKTFKGMTDAMLAELMAVVGMANESNRLASGYQVEIDDTFKTT